MNNTALRHLAISAVTAILGLSSQDAAAQADPVAIVVNNGSDALDVIDVNTATRWAPFASGSSASRPTDIVYDARSHRIFVSQTATIASFNAFLPDGRDSVPIPASGAASNIALDATGRRLFVTYRDAGTGQSSGLVNEVSIANLASPTVVQHTVPGMPDLQFVAWDAANARVYVVAVDGRIARTGNGNWTWTTVGGVGVVSPGGILANPSGGVWITGRSAPARLVRVFPTDILASYTMPAAFEPRGLNYDPSNADTIYVAVDDIGRIRKYSIAANTFINTMTTDPRPQDVVKTTNGWLVSVNRGSAGQDAPGSVSINVPGNLAPIPGFTPPVLIKPLSLVSVDTPRLFADPASHAYCYRRAGDTATKTFTLQNTRSNRTRMDLGPVTVGGSNPANYVLTGANTCSSARLSWGDSCNFTLRFTASGPSVQPIPPFGGIQTSTWPAQVSITSTDTQANATIPLSATLALFGCP